MAARSGGLSNYRGCAGAARDAHALQRLLMDHDSFSGKRMSMLGSPGLIDRPRNRGFLETTERRLTHLNKKAFSKIKLV
jgi:hypothetical protein